MKIFSSRQKCNSFKPHIKSENNFSLFLLFVFFSVSVLIFGQNPQNRDFSDARYFWTKNKIFDSVNEVSQVIKTKRLLLFDPTTRKMRCYLRTIKYYDKGKQTKKEYYTVTIGGCRMRRQIEKKYEKRFPHFAFFRFRVFILGNLGMKYELYE